MDEPSRTLIKKNHELPIKRQCELLNIPRSSYYYDPKEPTDADKEYEEQLMREIDKIHTALPCIGQRKILHILKEKGYPIGRKKVRRLMHEMGICPIYPKPNLSKCDFKEGIVPYRLRNRVIFLPNQAWSIDITYIPYHHGHMYLTAIIDWYSRRIMGWALSDSLETAEVIKAVREAVEKHGAPAILNSDQGSQFTSNEYKELLKELHIVQSMDGKSRWADNIMIERWFRSFKTEEIYINEYHSPRELRTAVREYVDKYNNLRPHAALDNKTPKSVYESVFADIQEDFSQVA